MPMDTERTDDGGLAEKKNVRDIPDTLCMERGSGLRYCIIGKHVECGLARSCSPAGVNPAPEGLSEPDYPLFQPDQEKERPWHDDALRQGRLPARAEDFCIISIEHWQILPGFMVG